MRISVHGYTCTAVIGRLMQHFLLYRCKYILSHNVCLAEMAWLFSGLQSLRVCCRRMLCQRSIAMPPAKLKPPVNFEPCRTHGSGWGRCSAVD